MNLNSLKLFNTFANELSFSKTASILYISQPAVSIQIKKLEDDLGLKLFEKTGKNLYLTDNGKLLYEYTKKIFTLVDEIELVFSTKSVNVKGVIEIGASNTPAMYILPQILAEFNRILPNVTINLHVGNTFDVEKMIYDNRVDFAVSGGEIFSNDIIHSEKLIEDEVILVTSPSSMLAGRENVERHELIGSKFVAHEKNSKLHELVERILNELGLETNTITTLGQVDAIKKAVSLGMGVSALPLLTVKDELQSGILEQFKIKDKGWFYPYSLIYNKKRHQSPASWNLMELICQRIKALRKVNDEG